MSCLDARASIDRLLDGELPPDAERELRAHLAGCAACARHAAVLTELAQRTRELPAAIDPPGDLWPGIDRRIAALERGEPVPAEPPRTSVWRPALVAAALLCAFALGQWWRGRPEAGPSTNASPPVTTDVAVREPVEVERVLRAERAFLEAKRNLRSALDERRESMSPETAAMVDRNLELIERSIAAIDAALARDPANRDLNRMLVAAHQREIALLQHVTQRASRL